MKKHIICIIPNNGGWFEVNPNNLPKYIGVSSKDFKKLSNCSIEKEDSILDDVIEAS